MRVLHIITGLAAGGAEHQLRMVLRHTRAQAHVAVLTNPGLLAQAIRAEGTPVHEVGMAGNTDLTALPRLTWIIRRGGYDVVHTHLYRSNVYGRVAARLAGTGAAIIATEHSLGDEHIEGRRLTAMARRMYLATERLGTTTVAVSPTVARRLVRWGVPPDRIEVIGNGIDATAFAFDRARAERIRASLGIPADRFVVGSVGRLVPGKRVDATLRALRGLPDVTALIVGDGRERAALTTLAGDLGVRAVFTGETDDVSGYLSTMDLFVAASGEETFGLAVIEALAAGLPVLYAACPALDDQPSPPPGARRLAHNLDDLRPALAEAVRNGPVRLPVPAAVRHYDIAALAARTDDLYERLTQTQPQSPKQWSPA
jgi:glycosyltransferase involved in cell wall biosynthesis